MKIKTSKYKVAMALLILIMCIISATVVVWVESDEQHHHRYDSEIDFVVSKDESHYRISVLDAHDTNNALRLHRVFVHVLNISVENGYSLDYITYKEDPDITDSELLRIYNRTLANITFFDNDNDGRLSKDDELLINEDFVDAGWEINCWYYNNREIMSYVFI